MGDVSKLPKWAQVRMATLERELARMTHVHDDWLEPHEGDDTFWKVPGSMDSKPLGKEETIRFQLGKHYSNYIDCRVEETRWGRRLMVMGGSSIDLQTRSGNYFTVGVLDR